jgi:hypothetical protein
MRIFYSWQSDLPNKTNRGLILEALEAAARRIKKDSCGDVTPVIDRDVQGNPGAPDIASSILDKILRTDAFVADVSAICTRGNGAIPNPNVLVELGFAGGTLGWERIVLVVNESYGPVTALPFDLRQRLACLYRSAESDTERAGPRNQLSAKLESALRQIALRAEAKQLPPTMHELRELEIQDVTRQRVLRPAKTLQALRQFLGWPEPTEAAADGCADVLKLGERLTRLPPNAARLLDVVNDRTTVRRWHRRAALLADVLAATEADEIRFYQLIRVLEEHRFVGLDDDEFEGKGPWIQISDSELSDWDILWDVREFCRARGILTTEILVNLRFDLLD